MKMLEIKSFELNSVLTNQELNKVRGGLGLDLESRCSGDEETDRDGDGSNDDCVMKVDDGSSDDPCA